MDKNTKQGKQERVESKSLKHLTDLSQAQPNVSTYPCLDIFCQQHKQYIGNNHVKLNSNVNSYDNKKDGLNHENKRSSSSAINSGSRSIISSSSSSNNSNSNSSIFVSLSTTVKCALSVPLTDNNNDIITYARPACHSNADDPNNNSSGHNINVVSKNNVVTIIQNMQNKIESGLQTNEHWTNNKDSNMTAPTNHKIYEQCRRLVAEVGLKTRVWSCQE